MATPEFRNTVGDLNDNLLLAKLVCLDSVVAAHRCLLRQGK